MADEPICREGIENADVENGCVDVGEGRGE